MEGKPNKQNVTSQQTPLWLQQTLERDRFLCHNTDRISLPLDVVLQQQGINMKSMFG